MHAAYRLHLAPLALLLLALVLVGPAAHAQTPDTTAAWRYYPLEMGNEWHYAGWERSSEGTTTETYELLYRVVGTDPAVPDAYVVETLLRTTVPGEPTTEDTQTQTWRYDPETRRIEVEDTFFSPTPCPLDAPFGGSAQCQSWGTCEVSGGYDETVEVGSDVVPTSRKLYTHFAGKGGVLVTLDWEYGADIGETRRELRSHGMIPAPTSLRTLRYARVGGQEYGEPLLPVANEVEPTSNALALAVHPNPSRTVARVRYTIPSASTALLVLYDVLGRAVVRVAEGHRPAGLHEAALDVSGLAPGAYVLRIETDRAVASRRLTVIH